MKKVSLLILVSLILLMAFASCDMLPPLFGEEPEPEHVHDWMEATCEAPKTCACGATEGEKLPHTWTEATCSSPKVCTFCNATEGAALNHNWVSADCETPATCTLCGTTSGEAQGHLWISASCDSAKHCANCNTEEGEPLEHVWEEATCLTPKTCTLCKATDGEAKGHVNETVAGFAATCTTNGLTDGTVCTVCGETTLAQQIIPALEHTASDWVVTSLPTCTEAGSQYKYCTVCSTEDYTVVLDTKSDAPLGHTEGEWIVDLDPTCEEKGKQHKECTVCGETVKTALIPVEGHVEAAAVIENNVAPDCENAGSYDEVVYCATCGDELARNNVTVDALGHKMADATCQVPSTCSVCGHVEGTVVPCQAGETKKENEVAPLCEANGSYDLATYCVWCNVELSRETVTVDALGHDMADATCQAPATCKNGCGKTEGQPLDQHTITVKSMSEELLYYTCASCDAYYVADKALVYDGSKLPQLAKNGDPTVKVNANGEYEVFAGTQKSQYMLYFPSNSNSDKTMFTDFTGAKNSVGVLSFKVKPNTLTENLRVIVMTARNNPNWDANGGWNGCSMDVMSFAPNGDGTWSVNGKNITNDTFATVSANEWVDVKMFMQLTSDGMFNISYYVNGEFCNVYSRDLLNAGSNQTIKDLSIQCVYICGWTEAGTGFYFDDLAFGYANDAEWAFDSHKHVWAAADCNSPAKCTACGLEQGEAIGHDLVAHEAQAPTCTEAGWNAYETCTRCDHTTYSEIPATGHNYGDATCDQAATCSTCGFSSGEALGHEFKDDAYVYNNDAKCGVDGTKTAKCSRCDATDTKTAEGTALAHNWADANCATASVCTLCGATQGEPNKAMHDKLTDTHVNGVTTYTCATCGYSFKVDNGDYMDGSSYNGMTCNASTNNNVYTTNPDKANYPVMKDGHYEFIRTDVEAGVQKQVQVWLPTASGSNKFAGFTSANNAVGFLSFKLDVYTDYNFEMKLVDASLPNDYDVNGDGATEYIRWTEYWGISAPVFSVGVPQNGKAAIVGFGKHLTSVDVNENNFTGWLDVDMRIALNPETDTIDVDYYLNGQYIGSASNPLTIVSNAITGVYINSNNKAAGTGYRFDDLAFGYTAHKHDFKLEHADGVTTLICECGNTYKVENGYYNDGAVRDFYYSANGTMPVNPVNGQFEAIFTPAVDTAPEAAGQGWAVNSNNKKLGGQHMWWIPTQTAGQGVQGFSCANNAVGLVSFKVQTNVDDPFAISLCKERGAADWNGWGTSETKLMYIGGYSANGIEIKDAKNALLTTVPVADGWSEWIDIQIAIELHENGTYDFYYYVNGALVGSLVGQTMNIDSKDFRALYINGWTYTPGTGVKLDDVVFGYTANGHNTLDGQLHKITNGANCGEKSTCSCGWTGYTMEHDFADATCGAPATCKGCGATEGKALSHSNLVPSYEGELVRFTCSDCNKCYTLDAKAYTYDGTSMENFKDVSNSKDKYSVSLQDGAYVAINNTNENIQAQMWLPTNDAHTALDGFSNANNAIGVLSFRINSGVMGSQGNDNLTFVLAKPRNCPTWTGWGTSDINVIKFGAAPNADATSVPVYGGIGAGTKLMDLPLTEGWTGWLEVTLLINLNSDNTIDLTYYINGQFVATFSGAMAIDTYDVRALHITGYTEVAGSGFMLDDIAFGYTLNGLNDAPVVEEPEAPFYTEEIAKESVSSAVLQTVVTNKIKQWDQSSAHNSHEGTPVFVKADMNGTEVTGVYFSKTTPWVGDEGEQFSEFRVNVDSSKPATGFSFVYKVEGTVDENKGSGNGGYTFKDLEGNAFVADAYVQIKTPKDHPLAGDNYPELSGTDFIIDGQWHTMSYTFPEALEITNMLFNFYHFQGQLIIAELEVTFVEECQHTNTTTTTVDPTCIAEGSNKVVCNDCGETLVDEVLPVVDHKLSYKAEGEGVVCYCTTEGCDAGYSVAKGYYNDGTNNANIGFLAANQTAGYTTNANGSPVVVDGYQVFAREAGRTDKGQVQFHVRTAAWADADKYFPDFNAAAGATGVIAFKINPNLDSTGNLRFIITNRVESGFGWSGTHSIDILTFSPATADGKINVTGWGGNALATLEKGEDGYTGWIDVKITIELSVNAKGENIGLVKYYINGEHVGTTHSSMKVVDGKFNNLYVTANSTEAGTGFMMDDLLFGYTPAHTHNFASEVTAPTCTEAGFTTFTCDCGETYTEAGEAALGHNAQATCGDAATCTACGEHFAATGAHNLSTVANDGKVSVVCSGCSRTYVCDTSYVYDGANTTWNWGTNGDPTITVNEEGQYVIKAGEQRSQYMLYIPSSNRNYAMKDFTNESHTLGVVSFDVKTDATETVRFILMEARNANTGWIDWSNNSVDVFAMNPEKDGTYRITGHSMTSDTLATVKANEWVNVQMIVELTPDSTMVIKYFINHKFVGEYVKDFNSDPVTMRLANNLIESLYICGYTGAGTGLTFDNLYIGYTEFGHWTFDDHADHVVTEATSCTAPATCTCGWTGDVLPHEMTEASCAAPSTCKTCGFTTGEALRHNYTTLVNNGTVKYLCEDCMLCYSVETGTLSDGDNPSDNVWKNFVGAGGAAYNGNGAYPSLVTGADGNNYFQYLKAETTDSANQVQIWLPSSGGNGLQGFTADANNVGFFSLDFNANMDHNCEWKFVDFSSDATRWSAEWAIDNPFFRMTTPSNGQVELRGFNGVAFATVELDENNYTGWMNLAFMITLDAEQDLVIVDYYLNGQYKATMSAPLTTKTNGICAIYMNGNAKAAGTGYMVDNIAFGYGSFGTHEHTWTNATCTTAKTCSGCGMTDGAALGHDFDVANCTSPKTCAICDATEGEALGHDMQPATCASASKCSRCSHTEGEALAHADENGDFKCDSCSTKMLPADGEALTIPQALAIAELAGTSYTTQKYYITGVITNVYNTQYGNMYIQDEDGNELCIYGLYSADGNTRYDAMESKPVKGDEVTVYTVLGMYDTTKQGKNAWLDEVVAHDHDYVESVTAPTCVASGYTTFTCSICSGSYMAEETEALGHTTDNGECERCHLTIGGTEPVIGVLATFDFGANGSAAHVDGNDLGSSKTYTAGSYSLALTGMSKVYGPAYDAKGNSCIKLGTSSKTGSFSFTVGEDVTEVVIYVAQYKANTTKITVNGVAYTITTASNSGAYTAITIDTSVTKTVSFATVSGGVRCMINTIEFKGNVA